MPHRDEPTTIGEIIALSPGVEGEKQWVSTPIDAIVRNPKTIKKGFYAADLVDPYNQSLVVEASGGVWFDELEGRIVQIRGKGISREEDYNGKAKIRLGRNVTVHDMAGAPEAPPQAESAQHYQERDSNPPGRPGGSPAQAQGPAAEGKMPPPSGPTVGMLMNNAITLTAAMGLKPGTQEFATSVYYIASDLRRVVFKLESGYLAHKPDERTGQAIRAEPEQAPEPEPPPAQPPPQQAQPPPSRPAPAASFDEEDDVPF